MYKASAGILLPTSIICSPPRPAWHTVQLGSRSFLEAMVNARWREQYQDAVSTHLRAQEVVGLDICTDGDAHYDEEIGGWARFRPQRWTLGEPSLLRAAAACRRRGSQVRTDSPLEEAVSSEPVSEWVLRRPGIAARFRGVYG